VLRNFSLSTRKNSRKNYNIGCDAHKHNPQFAKHWRKVRAVGVDGAAVLGRGEKQSVLVAVDLGSGEPIALANVDEKELPVPECFLADLSSGWE